MSDSSAFILYRPYSKAAKALYQLEPWRGRQLCPFCKFKHSDLIYDLLCRMWDIVPWEPHDFRDIKNLGITKPYIALNEASYKCPQCPLILRGRGRLICHVSHSEHMPKWIYDDNDLDSWDPESSRLWEPVGPFPFLLLPIELRYMVYENVFCYTAIEIGCSWPIDTDSTFLQNGTHTSLLSLLGVNRQIYNEGRLFFYGRNTFRFINPDYLPLFLLSIGRENAVLLRDIQVRNYFADWESNTDMVKFHMIRPVIDMNGSWWASELKIWNGEILYLIFARMMGYCDGQFLRRIGTDNASSQFILKRFLHEARYERGDKTLRGGVVFEVHGRPAFSSLPNRQDSETGKRE